MAASWDATSRMLENVENLIEIEQMQEAFGCLCSKEDDINYELDGLLEHQSLLESKMLGLHKMLPNLQVLQTDSKQLSGMISFTSKLAENVSSSTLDTSFKLLHEAEEKLRSIVHIKFDAAVHANDLASIERFVKIFPLVGLHDEGLAKFGKYLSSQLSETSDRNLRIADSMNSDESNFKGTYIDAATQLFEGIARIIEIHPKDLDRLSAEVVLLNTVTELYLHQIGEVEKFISSCDLSRLMQELIGSYIAITMETTDTGSHTSSMVDETFFVVKKCIRRAISSSSVDGLCAMLNHSCTVLEQDFREVLYSRIRSGFPSGFDLSQAYNMVQSSLQQGKLQSSDTEKSKSQFLMTLNNAEASCDYCKSLRSSLEEEISKHFNQVSEQSKAKLESGLTDLGAAANRFKDVVDFGFSQLGSSAIKPRIKPLTDAFLSASHNLSEEEFSNYEANDPWVENFIMQIDAMLASFKLGGLQFDKELRVLVSYLTSQ
ncbi:hypothetical protein KUTeg_019824 [Tegillarca granosa]|uniref:COG4 transport protein middle alpha-helical bundle domain-containing protein n=1 Tax=Tegillarca granosa TaxID=220873 RepID=A0ABQ9EDQ9_TEGGR|nr:hypothetical protein KUTeg_019824 [Tegillarca granosa]